MRATLSGFVILIGLISVFQSAYSQALYPVSLEEKVKNSTVIAEGKVESQVAFWNAAHTMIFTANKVKVYKVFAGSVEGDYIEILTQGGTVGNANIEVSELLDLEPGDVGMFFCFPDELKLRSPETGGLLYDVYSSAQGGYRYDTRFMAASAPFDRYSSITKGLYPAITSLTQRSFVNKQPSISFEPGPATTGASLMSVTGFSPQVVNAGALLQPDSNLLTIVGSGFGLPVGSAAVLFDDANDGSGGTPFVVSSTSALVTLWTDTEVRVKVPSRAGTGFFSVRNVDNVSFTSPQALVVNYSVSSVGFSGNTVILQLNLMSTNGLGGYDVVYSTSTANSGRDFNTSPEKATFQRALFTWRETCGVNFREGGTTTNQQINGSDGINTVVLDNTNTGVARIPAGTLAITYSYAGTCTSGGLYVFPGVKTGFDILIRNTGVSLGTTDLTLGPCPPATNTIQSDLETVLLHELGHAVNLGHINDTYQGTTLPFINPSKLMNYALVNGVKRTSLDYSAKSGGDYCVRNKGLTFGACSYTTPMTPLPAILESRDECPVNFPATITQNNTQIVFDLEHATSNVNTDPQYNAVSCTGQGTGVTNTAFTAFRTGSAGSLTLSVSGYTTVPADQINCTVAGVELSLYQVNSCPAGQNFPAPVACRSFNGNGVLSAITGLASNTTYLVMVDGIGNTKANFTLTLNGTVLPVKIKDFYGNTAGASNVIHWKFDLLSSIARVTLERSADGRVFEQVVSWKGAGFKLNGSFSDEQAPATSYYRLKFESTGGNTEYSNIINLVRRGDATWKIYPNPVQSDIILNSLNVVTGRYTAQVYNSSGVLVGSKTNVVTSSSQSFRFPASHLPAGVYRVIVRNATGLNVYQGSVTVLE